MTTRPSAVILAATFTALAWATLTTAQQPGYPKALASGLHNLAIAEPPNGFLGLSLASEPEGRHNRPVVCFGMRQVGDEYKYNYFIIFKTDRTKKWELGGGLGGGGLVAFGGTEASLEKTQLRFGDAKKLVISYKAAWDEKTRALVRESLTIDGEEYKKDGPRVFLCDLTLEKPTCKPLKVALPGSAPKVGANAEATSAALIQAIQEVGKKSAEVKEIFEGPPKK